MMEFSGDKILGAKKRLVYLFFNFCRGLSGYNTFLKIKYWHPRKVKEATINSPGREYSNRFLYENLSGLLVRREIKMLDIGCGSGYIREIFYNLGYRFNYTGVDILKDKEFEEFNKYALNSDFIQLKIEDFDTENKYDIVFSMCALEHIEDDFLVVSRVDKFLKTGGIQIHIIPTFWSLFLYLWHGYRQYTPSRLRKLFKKEKIRIYRLGGLFSFFLHLFFITIPEIFLGTTDPRRSNMYSKFVNVANKLDCLLPIFPSVYVVVTKNI